MDKDLTYSEIASKYNTSKLTVANINFGKHIYDFDLDYPIRKTPIIRKFGKIFELGKGKTRKFCIDCGQELVKISANRCVECARKHSRKVERPTAIELESKLKELQSFRAVSKYYGVSDKMVSKWCGYYNMPIHINNYKPTKEEKTSANITRSKKIQMIDIKTDEIIQSFISIEDAYRYLGVQSSSHISLVCRGKRKTAYGYKWAFAE